MLTLDIAHTHAVPALAGTPERGEHEFQTAFLIEEAGDDLRAPPLFQETAFQQVSGPDTLVMDSWTTQVSDAGVQSAMNDFMAEG